MFTFSEYEKRNSVEDLPHTAIYFDHKMADFMSSFPLIIPKVIKNCKDLRVHPQRPPCPLPPYKSSSSEESKRRVNFEMLQKI